MAEYKTNPWVHTLYINAILLIILLAVIILLSKESICEAAFANVSFAATLLSIVLAVISIVISVVASFKTYNNLGGMNEVEARLNMAVRRLEEIDSHILATDRTVRSIMSLLQPTPQSQIESDAEQTLKEINESVGADKGKETAVPKSVYTVADIRLCEQKAIVKIADEFGLTNLMHDYSVRGISHMSFDAIARKDGIDWLIEIKFFHPGSWRQLLYRMKDAALKITTRTGIPARPIVGFILTDTSDKAALEAQLRPIFTNEGIEVRFYYLRELYPADSER